MQLVWPVADAEAANATYIGRRGCKTILGIELDTTMIDKRVDNCQIDIPVQHLGKVIAMLRQAQKAAKARKAGASRQFVGLMNKAARYPRRLRERCVAVRRDADQQTDAGPKGTRGSGF